VIPGIPFGSGIGFRREVDGEQKLAKGIVLGLLGPIKVEDQ
jgi:hypothetical protein